MVNQTLRSHWSPAADVNSKQLRKFAGDALQTNGQTGGFAAAECLEYQFNRNQ
jgi:hypothetical protein